MNPYSWQLLTQVDPSKVKLELFNRGIFAPLGNENIFNECYKPYLNNNDRYLFLWGGAGSGKSVFAAQKILSRIFTEKTNHRFLCVRKIGNTIHGSIYNLFDSLIKKYNLYNLVTSNKTSLSFKFFNGSEIITSGMDDPEKLKSIANVTGIWAEEVTELDKADFDQLDLRLRGKTDYYKQILSSFNPISETHWLKPSFFDINLDNCTTVHTTYLDNSFIDDEYVKVLNDRIGNDENLKRIYVDGQWGRIKTGAEFYSSFKYKIHVKPCQLDNSKIYHLSFDQNVVPYNSCVIAQIKQIEKKWIVSFIDEIALKNPYNKTENICNEFIRKYEDCERIFYYGDATSRKRDTRNQYNDYEIIALKLKKYLSNTSDRVPYSNPSVTKRRDFINRIFDGRYPIEIQIDPKCKLLINDFESVIEDVDGTKLKRNIKDKITGQSYQPEGHLSDCFDYMIVAMFRDYFDNMKHLG